MSRLDDARVRIQKMRDRMTERRAAVPPYAFDPDSSLTEEQQKHEWSVKLFRATRDPLSIAFDPENLMVLARVVLERARSGRPPFQGEQPGDFLKHYFEWTSEAEVLIETWPDSENKANIQAYIAKLKAEPEWVEE